MTDRPHSAELRGPLFSDSALALMTGTAAGSFLVERWSHGFSYILAVSELSVFVLWVKMRRAY
jgi:hypothetical protein